MTKCVDYINGRPNKMTREVNFMSGGTPTVPNVMNYERMTASKTATILDVAINSLYTLYGWTKILKKDTVMTQCGCRWW